MTATTVTPQMIATALLCDVGGCPASVVHLVDKEDLTLGFCGHHYTVHEVGLAGAGWAIRETVRVVDE